MTTLREEIKERLERNKRYAAKFVTDEDVSRIQNKTTDEIISIFEKMVDEAIEWFKTEYKGNTDPYILIGYFEDFKKEIRKK